MSEREEPVADLKSLEAALASLTPSVVHLDRDQLMYLAGRASAPPRNKGFMPLAVAASLLFAATSGGLWWAERVETVRLAKLLDNQPPQKNGTPAPALPDDKQFLAFAVQPRGTEPFESVRRFQYGAMRKAVLAGGVEALPKPTGGEAGTAPPPISRLRLSEFN